MKVSDTMRRKIINFLARLMKVDILPFSEIIVTDNQDYLLALVSSTEIVEYKDYRVIAN